MDKKEEIEGKIIRFLSGSCSSDESELLINWLNESNENRLYYFNIKRIWQECIQSSRDKAHVETSWNRLKLRLDGVEKQTSFARQQKISILLKKLAVAAGILILVSSSIIFVLKNYNISQYSGRSNEISVPFGSRISVTLPDSTKVWLNSGSKLVYDFSYGTNDRVVSLEGEAFFEVARVENSLFIVETSDLEIRVLGTRFNVKSYPDEKTIETTLVSGKVEINVIDGNASISPVVLVSSQKMTYARGDKSMMVQTGTKSKPADIGGAGHENLLLNPIRVSRIANPENEASWKEGKLIFRSESLENLARKLERYYNVEIIFRNDSIKNLRYSGTLDEVTIEEVLKAIAKASSISYEITKNQIVLK